MGCLNGMGVSIHLVNMPKKSAYVGMETLNLYTLESAPATLTRSIVRTGCDRYANRIMLIHAALVDITPIDIVANQLISQRWTLSTDPNKTSEPWVNNKDAILGGVRHVYFGATVVDTHFWQHQPGFMAFPVPLEVADDELYLYLQCIGGGVAENILVKLYITYKEVSKERFLDVLETFR